MKIINHGISTLLFVFILLVFASSATHANHQNYSESYNSGSPVRIDVIDDRGNILNQYSAKDGKYRTQRTYLEANKGKRYQLRIRNTSNRRIGVVVAVDGRNILTGSKSYLRSNEKMYVLDPYETASYKGWRTSKNQVNRFYFTSAGDSYSNTWGDRTAMGVIAVGVFNERKRHQYKKHNKQLNKHGAPAGRGYLRDESTGTGFGNEEYSPTINVRFKAKNKAAFKHFYKYEWRSTLCKQGIIDCHSYERPREYNRFWPREANNGYAPYPPSYSNNKSWSDQFTRSWEYDYKRGW